MIHYSSSKTFSADSTHFKLSIESKNSSVGQYLWMLDQFLSDNSKNAKSGEVRENNQNKAFVRIYFSKVAEFGT